MYTKVCLTSELSSKECIEIVNGFNETFDAKMSVESFKRYYLSKCLGYSFHSLAIDDNDEVVGSTTVVPYKYKDNHGRIFLAGLSGGTYVRKKFRKDEFLFFEMYAAIRQVASAKGLEIILGVPNNNSFLYLTKFLKFKYLFDLDYFVLPLRVSNVMLNGRFRFLNSISFIFAFVWFLVSYSFQFLIIKKRDDKVISIVTDKKFYTHRFDERYKKFNIKKYKFWYRIVEEGNIKLAYIFDFREGEERTLKALYKAVWWIIVHEKTDIVVYIGTMNIKQFVLFKMPKAKVPQRFRLTVDVLKSENYITKMSYLCPENWSFGLMNFDVR